MVTLTAAYCSAPLLRLPQNALFSPPMPAFSPVRVPGLRRRFLSSLAATVRQDSTIWTQAPLTLVEPASADASHFHVFIDVSDSPDISGAFTDAGQYVQVRIPSAAKPCLLYIASPPSIAASRGELEFLIKKVAGSTAEMICGLKRGDVVEIGGVLGTGFDVERISPPEEVLTVLLFATGTAISPIRSLIESGFDANKRSDVRLYYGAQNLHSMAYQDRFKDWEATGVRIVPVLSQPDDTWKGERGYIQAAFSRAKQIADPSSTAAVLCGYKQMIEDVTSVLVADGVSNDKILKSF